MRARARVRGGRGGRGLGSSSWIGEFKMGMI